MIFVIVAIAEAIFESGEEVFGVETGTQLSHELDIRCIGTTQIEEAQIPIGVERANKLLEGRTGTHLRRGKVDWFGGGRRSIRPGRRARRAQAAIGIVRSLNCAE